LAVTTGKRLGGAVVRNRARRRIREAARPYCRSLPGGWDYLLVARKGSASASFRDLSEAVRSLFARAGAAQTDDGSASRTG
jgi:ribonuclease P protein component